jgi:spore coat protein CotF
LAQSQGGQQGQQAGQAVQAGQYSGQGMQFSDKDILQLILNESKHTVASLNTYITEASSAQLRQDYMNVLGDIYNEQKQVSDLMQTKGYYNVKNANPQDVATARSKFSGQS